MNLHGHFKLFTDNVLLAYPMFLFQSGESGENSDYYVEQYHSSIINNTLQLLLSIRTKNKRGNRLVFLYLVKMKNMNDERSFIKASNLCIFM